MLMSSVPQDGEISIRYSLFDLPGAQHKAGLAGLLLLIESMQGRGLSPLPSVSELTATSVKLTFTQAAVQTVFDDLYDAEVRETESKTRWKGKAPKWEESIEVTDPKTGKVKRGKIFVYDAVVPKASFLEHHYPGNENGWLKLWRDMLWNTLRGRPTTRLVYEERAKKQPSGVAKVAWKELVEFSKSIQRGILAVTEIPSSFFIGAQATNAEKVSFNGRVDHALLLHFWPLTVQIFVPEVIDHEGNNELSGKEYVLAIPEVSNLEEFCDVFPHALGTLDPQLRGYRPRASIIDLPAEGGLEFLRHLARIAQQKTGSGELKYSVSAIELFHLEKQGNNVKMLAVDRVVPREGLLSQYEGIRAFCRNPFFKSQLLLNLLRDVDWYEGFVRLFAVYPWEFFIHTARTPKTFPLFSFDVRKKFEILGDEFQRQQEAHAMTETSAPKLQSLEKRIYDMIGAYVRLKTEDKSGIRWEDFKDKKTVEGKLEIPQAYLEARHRVCADVFLAMRSRRDQDFIEYFTGTICSVPQFLPPDDYVLVSQALLEDGGWEKVKALSMLAVAAHS
jgi:CRISPR-associated protein Cmx8